MVLRSAWLVQCACCGYSLVLPSAHCRAPRLRYDCATTAHTRPRFFHVHQSGSRRFRRSDFRSHVPSRSTGSAQHNHAVAEAAAPLSADSAECDGTTARRKALSQNPNSLAPRPTNTESSAVQSTSEHASEAPQSTWKHNMLSLSVSVLRRALTGVGLGACAGARVRCGCAQPSGVSDAT